MDSVEPRVDQQAVAATLKRHLLDWFGRDGKDPKLQVARIQANSLETPKKIRLLLGPLSEPLKNSPPQSVLDVGCGFASIPVFLASQWPQARVLATDVTDRYYECGQKAAQELALGNISFLTKPIEEIEAMDAFDLVLSCNMLNFMNSRERLNEALFRMWRAAKPGGYICIYTPHFWTLREPFTRVPLLHLLPIASQDRLARRWHMRSTMLDVRSPSISEIRASLRSYGASCLGVSPGLAKRLRVTHAALWFQK